MAGINWWESNEFVSFLYKWGRSLLIPFQILAYDRPKIPLEMSGNNLSRRVSQSESWGKVSLLACCSLRGRVGEYARKCGVIFQEVKSSAEIRVPWSNLVCCVRLCVYGYGKRLISRHRTQSFQFDFSNVTVDVLNNSSGALLSNKTAVQSVIKKTTWIE